MGLQGNCVKRAWLEDEKGLAFSCGDDRDISVITSRSIPMQKRAAIFIPFCRGRNTGRDRLLWRPKARWVKTVLRQPDKRSWGLCMVQKMVTFFLNFLLEAKTPWWIPWPSLRQMLFWLFLTFCSYPAFVPLRFILYLFLPHHHLRLWKKVQTIHCEFNQKCALISSRAVWSQRWMS